MSRSSYYAWLNRPESARSEENMRISALIKEIWLKSKKRYGYPKIAEELRKRGIHISNPRVWRLMCVLGIKSVTMKKYRPGDSKKDNIVRKNELNQNFSADSPNAKWVTDITYIKTVRDGWTYLASVMDLFTRKIIGWSFGRKITADLALAALDIALEKQNYPTQVILHSDMGCQYTSELFMSRIRQHGLIQSFSKKGCPYDNASIESFHGILKREEVNLRQYKDFDSAKLALFDFIEGWYNQTRIHSSLGYRTPQEAENAYYNSAD